MPKNIVFLADGTWNEPDSQSNVYKMFKAAATSADQITRYDDGVGADALPFARLLAGAIGEGLSAKIQKGYAFIAA